MVAAATSGEAVVGGVGWKGRVNRVVTLYGGHGDVGEAVGGGVDWRGRVVTRPGVAGTAILEEKKEVIN